MNETAKSLTERDKRWSDIRHELAKYSLDAIVVVSDSQMERRGSVRYVSNMDAGAYTTLLWHYVCFPLVGEPKAINVKGGWIKESRLPYIRGGWVPESAPYTEVLVDFIRELNLEKGKIGIEGDIMPAVVYQQLAKRLPEAEFKQVNIIHQQKRIKSPFEIELIKQGVETMDKAFEACLGKVKTGMTWNDITSYLCRKLYQWGAEDIGGYPLCRSNDIIQNGDSYNFYPEVQVAGGYWIQFGRLLSFGEPEKKLRKAWELNVEAQVRGAEKLKPGYTGADIMEAINSFLKGSPYTGASRSSGHGIGLDILEKPYISSDEEIVFEPGMVVSIHPVFFPPVSAFEANADMFVVTEDKPIKLSRSTSEIAVIG
jgi:Xaa-Pro aminopeptidase